jgi:hypothetical protein
MNGASQFTLKVTVTDGAGGYDSDQITVIADSGAGACLLAGP